LSRELTEEQSKKIAQVDAISDRFISELAACGAEGHVIGIRLDVSPDVQCLSRVAGDSAALLNLIGAIAANLMPEDFQRLLVEFHTNLHFAHLREVPKSQRPTTVN
jgi:hypothetical protein